MALLLHYCVQDSSTCFQFSLKHSTVSSLWLIYFSNFENIGYLLKNQDPLKEADIQNFCKIFLSHHELFVMLVTPHWMILRRVRNCANHIFVNKKVNSCFTKVVFWCTNVDIVRDKQCFISFNLNTLLITSGGRRKVLLSSTLTIQDGIFFKKIWTTVPGYSWRKGNNCLCNLCHKVTIK